MKKGLSKTLVVLGASIMAFVALTLSASACYFGMYQPKEPRLLREE